MSFIVPQVDSSVSSFVGGSDDFGGFRTLAKFASNYESIPKIEADVIIQRFYLQSVARSLLPSERVAECLRKLVPNAGGVAVMYSASVQRAHYKNLVVCSRLWQCPVCAAKITERRRVELSRGAVNWSAAGGSMVLLTYTLRHNLADTLKSLLVALKQSGRFFKSGRWFQSLKSEYGWAGSVVGLELTHGVSGWHPHQHELVFLRGKLDAAQLAAFTSACKNRWLAALAACGGDALWEYGLDVRASNVDVQAYIVKWGHEPVQSRWSLEHEVAKSPMKQGREGGRSPLQLLMDCGDGDEIAGRLWVEYSRVFKGRRQLAWSNGLRKLLGLTLVEKSDAELAKEVEEKAVLLAMLTPAQWRVVLGNDVRGELLRVAAAGDEAAFWEWFNSL